MIKTALTRLAARFGGDGSDDEGDADAGFVRSRLDAAVLAAHAGPDGDRERELADIQERAARLEEHRAEY